MDPNKSNPQNFDDSEFSNDPFGGFSEKDASRALQTFFRTSFRTHVTMAANADRKANIMLRLNSFLLGGAIIFYEDFLEPGNFSTVTLIIFIITTLTSLIIAAIVARPHGEVVKHDAQEDPGEASKKIFFLTHFVGMKQEDYEKAFGIMAKDAGLIYGNMARDVYHIGKVLAQKYKLLRISYNVFIYGFILTMISFLINFWMV